MSHLHLGPSVSMLRGHFVAFPVCSHRLKPLSHRDYSSLFNSYKQALLDSNYSTIISNRLNLQLGIDISIMLP
jgi:hypothetical protein